MRQIYNISSLCILTFLLIGCERESLSPVEIKLDDDSGYKVIGAVVNQDTLMTTHVVNKNETLFDVAYYYNVDPMNLAQINNIKPPYDVKNGQVLKLPNNSTVQSTKDNEQKKKDIVAPSNAELNDHFNRLMTPSEDTMSVSRNNEAIDLSTPKANKPIIPKISNASTTKMTMPVKGKILSKFGDLQDGVANDGINIASPFGTSVKAASDGKVIYVGDKLEEEFGNVVILQHKDNLITSYAHLDKIKVRNGANVLAGDIIGTVGKTGDVSSPQLHFEVMKNKKPVNPMKYL